VLASVRRGAVTWAVAAVALVGCASQIASGRHSAVDRARPAAELSAVPTARAAAGRSSAVPGGDWATFDYDAERSGVGPADTGITAHNLSALRTRTAAVPGTVDSSAVELHAVRIDGRLRDVGFMTTSYGIAFALDLGTGQVLWKYTPGGLAE
jgi:glucose dehydrogenase